MSKFKVGDTVRMVCSTRYAKEALHTLNGRTGVVEHVDKGDQKLKYRVFFPDMGRDFWINGKDLKKEGK